MIEVSLTFYGFLILANIAGDKSLGFLIGPWRYGDVSRVFNKALVLFRILAFFNCLGVFSFDDDFFFFALVLVLVLRGVRAS